MTTCSRGPGDVRLSTEPKGTVGDSLNGLKLGIGRQTFVGLIALSVMALGCDEDSPDPRKDGSPAASDAAPEGPAPSDAVFGAGDASTSVDGAYASDAGAWPDATLAADAQSAAADADSPGDASGANVDAMGPPTPPVTVIVMPDTQYYASSFPDVFTTQTQWILAQKNALNIAAVLHVGDVVDTPGSPAEWARASAAMRILDGIIPYVLVAGNHDTDANRKGLMDTYFGPPSMPWITGTMNTGEIGNSYALIDVGPVQWIVLGLEFGPRDAVMTWADSVLKAYPDRPAMIVTHAYLYRDGTRYDNVKSGPDTTAPNYQYWIPQYYGYTASEGINDGESIWQKVILPNRNVRLVFSGHDTGYARLTSTRPDGSVVHQMLSDYQWYRTDAPDYYGGGGYLRTLQLDYDKKEIRVKTFSPYLNVSLTDEQNEFTISLDL